MDPAAAAAGTRLEPHPGDIAYQPFRQEATTNIEDRAPGSSNPDREAAHRLAAEILRENLRQAVEGVLAARFRDRRVHDALFAELAAAIDAAVDDHIAAQALGETLVSTQLTPAAAQQVGQEGSAIAALRVKAQSVFGTTRPGIRRAGSVAMRIVPAVVESLTSVVHDEAAFARVEQAAQLVLGRYIHPVVARQVVGFAAAAARRAARSQPREGTPDGDPPRGSGAPTEGTD